MKGGEGWIGKGLAGWFYRQWGDIAVIISCHKRTTFGWTQESGDQLIEMRLLGGMFGTNANLRNAAKYPTTLGENFRSDF